MRNRDLPEINAGSMADIAFLLLIFFLVTTTMSHDLGIIKKIPKETHNDLPIKDRNALQIFINSNNELLLENSTEINISDLKEIAINFIDNGAKTDANGNVCDWCNGAKDPNSSDHPKKAVIDIKSSRGTSYGTYIKVQNEILAAYAQLRDELSFKLYKKSYKELEADYKSSKSNSAKEKLENIRNKYPQLITESSSEDII